MARVRAILQDLISALTRRETSISPQPRGPDARYLFEQAMSDGRLNATPTRLAEYTVRWNLRLTVPERDIDKAVAAAERALAAHYPQVTPPVPIRSNASTKTAACESAPHP